MNDLDWNGPQNWVRDGEGPCVSLGGKGAFDDMHVFAPCVARENGEYRLWYCGSRGEVADRVFRMGLATSADGIHFEKHHASPVLGFPDGRHSILTPTLLRNLDGTPQRENGRLRMWFAACDLPSSKPRHTLHESTSEDGLTWTPPSEPLLENLYAPTILREGDTYHMWYTDVTRAPWMFRYAASRDGRSWRVHPEPILVMDQPWEHGRLFYPTVVKHGDLYLMWYGSYALANHEKTSLGFAVSRDRLTWRKHPANPLFGPDPSRIWESNFATSQSIMRLPDGSWRIWYASRTKPPFVHKYFAIGTARMNGGAGW